MSSDALTERKVRWARKQAGKERPVVRRPEDRLPPGQHLTGGFPVLDWGIQPVIVPKLYAWKGAKFVRTVEFLAEDKLEFWEVRGSSNTADPWTDDRFA